MHDREILSRERGDRSPGMSGAHPESGRIKKLADVVCHMRKVTSQVHTELPSTNFFVLRRASAMQQLQALISKWGRQTFLLFSEAFSWILYRYLVTGRRIAQTAKFSSEGLASALDSLLATCPPAKTITAGAGHAS